MRAQLENAGILLGRGKDEFFIRGLQETIQLGPKEFGEWRDKIKNGINII